MSFKQIKIRYLTKKAEYYLQRDLQFLMRDTLILHDLDIAATEIEKILVSGKHSPQQLQAHFEKETERAEKYSEILERRLNRWLKRLDHVLAKEESMTQHKEALQELRNHLHVCQGLFVRILSRGGELDIVVRKKNWPAVSRKITEVLGDATHPGIRSLIIVLEKLKSFEEEIKKYNEEWHTNEKLGISYKEVIIPLSATQREFSGIKRIRKRILPSPITLSDRKNGNDNLILEYSEDLRKMILTSYGLKIDAFLFENRLSKGILVNHVLEGDYPKEGGGTLGHTKSRFVEEGRYLQEIFPLERLQRGVGKKYAYWEGMNPPVSILFF